MIDLTSILKALIGLLATIITAYLIPWINAHTNNEQRIGIQAIVKSLVFAAEQLYGAKHGDEKLAYVVEKLKEKKIIVDRDEIEAIVAEYLNYGAICIGETMPDVPKVQSEPE